MFNTVGSTAEEFCINLVRNGGLLIDASSEYYVPQDSEGFIFCKIYSMWLKFLQVNFKISLYYLKSYENYT